MPIPRHFTDSELFGSEIPYKDGGIELGTVGWDDGSPHYDLGTEENDGHTLVRVTLFRGRRPGETPKHPTRAQGVRLSCRISGPIWWIPNDGDQVLVALPAGFALTPGAGMIIAAPGKNPTKQFAKNNGKDVILDFGPDRRAVIKAGLGVVLSDYEDRYLGVSPEMGVKCGDANACGFALKDRKWLMYIADANGEAKAALQLAANETMLLYKAGGNTSAVKLEDGKAWLAADSTYMFSAGVYLGIAPASPATGVLYGPSPGTTSLSVFVSA